MTTVTTRKRVESLLAAGATQNEVARTLGLTKSTVAYHARRLGRPVDERCNRRYDWQEVQAYYDEGHTVDECIMRFGFSKQTWHAATKRGVLRPRPVAMPIEELLASPRARTHVKMRLLRAGWLSPECYECGISEWRGKPLSLALHHINGNGQDNRLENLQLLCPNCHSQTENFAGRNRGRAA